MKVFPSFGQLVQLIRSCVKSITPFFIYLLVWIAALLSMYNLLGGVASELDKIDPGNFWQYFILIW